MYTYEVVDFNSKILATFEATAPARTATVGNFNTLVYITAGELTDYGTALLPLKPPYKKPTINAAKAKSPTNSRSKSG